ncbi:hypothetical protein MKW98_020336, partial [Papaver atlanticum]
MEEKSAVDERIERRHSPPLTNSAAAWLVIRFQDEGTSRNQVFYNICEPNKKTIRKSIYELRGSNRIYQKPSHQGWLVLHYDDFLHDISNFGNCFLWNPFSLKTIQLPNLEAFLDNIYGDQVYRIYDCVLSSPPLINNLVNDNDASMVYFIVSVHRNDIYSMPMIVYCGVGDAKWRKLEIPEGIICGSGLTSLICFKDKLYVMGCNDHCLLVIE